MVIIVQRKTDKKYLQSFQGEWGDSINDAIELSLIDYDKIKSYLSQYSEGEISITFNPSKIRFASKEEKKEIKNRFK